MTTESLTCCRLIASSLHGVPETSNSMMNSMLTAMRSGISAVGRRMGVSLPQTLRKMLEGNLGLPACLSMLLADAETAKSASSATPMPAICATC